MAWIKVTFARPGHGKSLDAARTVLKLFPQYERVERKYPELPKRFLLSNMKFSKAIEDIHLNSRLSYWDKFDELRYCPRVKCWRDKAKHALHDVDLLIDELPDYCPADGWRDLPRWARKMFSQHRHRGIRIFGIAQDYMAIDINFRRMVGEVWEVKKMIGSRDISATLPPVKRVWGIIMLRQFDPRMVESEGVNSPTLQPVGRAHYFLIRRKLVDVYDTTQELPEWRPQGLEHMEFTCVDPKCKKVHVEHRKI